MEQTLIIVVVCLIIFLICREFTCWYFKFNKMIEIMDMQNYYLSKILEVVCNDSDELATKEIVKSGESPKEFFGNLFKVKKCQKCGRINKNTADACSGCGSDL